MDIKLVLEQLDNETLALVSSMAAQILADRMLGKDTGKVSIKLHHTHNSLIFVIKALRLYLGLGLVEAKKLVESGATVWLPKEAVPEMVKHLGPDCVVEQ